MDFLVFTTLAKNCQLVNKKLMQHEPSRKIRELPRVLLGCIVEYLDMGRDVFLPGFDVQWKRTTRFTELKDQGIHRRVNGTLHSVDDIPAIEIGGSCHSKQWYKHGNRHRDRDLPAVVSHVRQEWIWNGQLHREGDQPAIIYPNGRKEWWCYGRLHREGDKPAIECSDGTRMWFWNGEKHRDHDYPAIERANGTKEWWQHGLARRDGDKPIVELENKRQVWYVNGHYETRTKWYTALWTCLTTCHCSKSVAADIPFVSFHDEFMS